VILENFRLPADIRLRGERLDDPLPWPNPDVFVGVNVTGEPSLSSQSRWVGRAPESDAVEGASTGTVTLVTADEYHVPNTAACGQFPLVPPARGQQWSWRSPSGGAHLEPAWCCEKSWSTQCEPGPLGLTFVESRIDLDSP
jgi:hypothetical protein